MAFRTVTCLPYVYELLQTKLNEFISRQMFALYVTDIYCKTAHVFRESLSTRDRCFFVVCFCFRQILGG